MREARERVDLADMKIVERTVETARRHSECRGATASFERWRKGSSMWIGLDGKLGEEG